MAPASVPGDGSSKHESCHDAAAQGWLHGPTAASQFPMSLWTLRFKDESAEAAHQETRAKSPTLIFVLGIFNAICLVAYCTGVALGCRTIRTKFSPLMVLNMPYQAIELYFYLRTPISEQAGLFEFLETLKFVWIGVIFVFLNLWSYAFTNEVEEACNGGASAEFCSHIGLVANGNAAVCFVLIPYVTHSRFALKMCISGMIVSVHALSPFWLPVGIEVPAIGISVAVGNAVGYVLEHSLRSTFREQYARQADQELLMQMKVAANMRLTHTIK
eukprot:1172483-Pleurochrysis_carterae.AAC.2